MVASSSLRADTANAKISQLWLRFITILHSYAPREVHDLTAVAKHDRSDRLWGITLRCSTQRNPEEIIFVVSLYATQCYFLWKCTPYANIASCQLMCTSWCRSSWSCWPASQGCVDRFILVALCPWGLCVCRSASPRYAGLFKRSFAINVCTHLASLPRRFHMSFDWSPLDVVQRVNCTAGSLLGLTQVFAY